MERVLRKMLGIISHLFIFSTAGLFLAFSFPTNPFASILGSAGFLGIIICGYTLVMHFVSLIQDRINGDS